MTGAAARGSADLVSAHVAALSDDARDAGDAGGGRESKDEEGVADAGELYLVLARRMVALARRSGRLDARAARSVLARLRPGG